MYVHSHFFFSSPFPPIPCTNPALWVRIQCCGATLLCGFGFFFFFLFPKWMVFNMKKASMPFQVLAFFIGKWWWRHIHRPILGETDPRRCLWSSCTLHLCWFRFMPALGSLTNEGCHSHSESLKSWLFEIGLRRGREGSNWKLHQFL